MTRLLCAVLLFGLVGCEGWGDCPAYRIVQNHDKSYQVQRRFAVLPWKDGAWFRTIEEAREHIATEKANCKEKYERRVVE